MTSSASRKWLIRLGYSAFFSITFMAALALTFPSDVLKQRLSYELERALGMPVTVNDVSIGPMGLSSEGITLLLPSKENKGARRRLRIDEFRAFPTLSHFIRGDWGASFSVEALGGHVEGAAAGNPDFLGVRLNEVQLPLQKLLKALGQDALDVTGDISGEASLDYIPKKTSENTGGGKITLSKAKIIKGELFGISLPSLEIGTLGLEGKLEGNKLQIDKLQAKGGDLDLSVEGNINVNYASFGRSGLAAKAKLKITDAFWKKQPDFEGVAKMMLTKYERTDGYYGFSFTGTLKNPKPRTYKN